MRSGRGSVDTECETPSAPSRLNRDRARFLPFPGIRYDARARAVATSPGERSTLRRDRRGRAPLLEARDPHNAVRLILPDAYDEATATLRSCSGAPRACSRTDDGTAFSGTGWTSPVTTARPQRTTGVLGALALDDDGGDVLPHERTMPKAKTDRLALLRATRANLDPIWGLSLADGPRRRSLDRGRRPLAHASTAEGVRPRARGAIDRSRRASPPCPTPSARAPLVLADGHHRFETACTYRDERRAAASTTPAPTRS